MRPFNFLQYPALARQRKSRHRWQTSLAGLVVGLASAWGLLQWGQQALADMQQERARLQKRLDDITLQQQTHHKQQALQKKWDQQALHLSQVSQQQAIWQVLHRALLQEPNLSSARFLSLQMDPDKFELQGVAPDLERMDGARQRVSRALMEASSRGDVSPAQLGAPVLTLRSLVLSEVRPGDAADHLPQTAGLEFVWQGAWPLIGPWRAPAAQADQPAPGRKGSP